MTSKAVTAAERDRRNYIATPLTARFASTARYCRPCVASKYEYPWKV